MRVGVKRRERRFPDGGGFDQRLPDGGSFDQRCPLAAEDLAVAGDEGVGGGVVL